MLSSLVVRHRVKPHLFSPHERENKIIWETCLRSLAFLNNSADQASHAISNAGSPNPNPGPPNHDEIYQGEQAYQFLLEVIAGLKSPVLGETEVLGQFKIFAFQWLEHEPHWSWLVQHLLSDAKRIRTRYLQKLGTQSYGGWLRKNLKASRVHILGAGHLSQQIVPYLDKQFTQVIVHARRPEAVTAAAAKGSLTTTPPTFSTHALHSQKFDHGALIIAAPMTAQEIQQWLNGRMPEAIYDFRGDSEEDKIDPPLGFDTKTYPSLTTLTEIFRELEHAKSQSLPMVKKAQEEIYELSQRWLRKAIMRPQGWDDVCA